MSSPRILNIKEFHPDLIPPLSENCLDRKAKEAGGFKMVIIGRPFSGKSFLIRYLLYAKKHIFPVGAVMSTTEGANQFYSKIFPPTFIYDKLNRERMSDFKTRQVLARRHLDNPWGVYIFDDVTDDPTELTKPIFMDFFKNGRQWTMWLIIALQYGLDLKPGIRNCIDGCFIFREPNIKSRQTLFENYAGIVGDFSTFCELMDELTEEYHALYIHNRSTSNKLEDCVYFFKAPTVPDFRFGCQDYWEHSNARYNPEYVETI